MNHESPSARPVIARMVAKHPNPASLVERGMLAHMFRGRICGRQVFSRLDIAQRFAKMINARGRHFQAYQNCQRCGKVHAEEHR